MTPRAPRGVLVGWEGIENHRFGRHGYICRKVVRGLIARGFLPPLARTAGGRVAVHAGALLAALDARARAREALDASWFIRPPGGRSDGLAAAAALAARRRAGAPRLVVVQADLFVEGGVA